MWRIIDISGDGYYVCVQNENLSILKEQKEVLHASFADIHSIVFHGNNIVYTNNAIQKCLENKIPIIFCDKSHLPFGLLLPNCVTIEYGQKLNVQINTSQPLKKQAWKQIIIEKLINQSLCLKQFGKEDSSNKIIQFSKEVKSGDSTFREGVSAKIYFSSLFDNFTRDKNKTDILNISLNYGYIVLRSSIARAIVSSGLNPAIGIFHSQNHNPFCLVDDLMEPFRPIVDYQIKQHINEFLTEQELTPNLKRLLVLITETDLYLNNTECKFTFALQKYIQSYLNYVSKYEEKINFPKIFK